VFDQPRHLRSTFSITFAEVRNVANWERQIYHKLRDRYFPAKPLQAPDSSAGTTALLFQSQHGHSQILVAPDNLAVQVAYSPDWQTNMAAARDYVVERGELLFDILKLIGDPAPLFCGYISQVRMPWLGEGSDEALMNALAGEFVKEPTGADYHDILTRVTRVVDGLYFSNVTVQSYRNWTTIPDAGFTFRLSRRRAAERGIEITVDFNTRYAFNEDKDLKIQRETLPLVVDKGLAIVEQAIERVRRLTP
jgi:hypothetical protein